MATRCVSRPSRGRCLFLNFFASVKAEIPVLGGPTFRGLLFFAIASHIVALICNLGIVAQKIRDRQYMIKLSKETRE